MKIKISLELVGDEFHYDWEIGGERQGGSMPFGFDHFEYLCTVIRATKKVEAYKKLVAEIPIPKAKK